MASKQVEFHEAAGLEFEAAFAWYFERSKRAAFRFALEVERAIATIADAPERFPAGISNTRRFLLQRFPFAVVPGTSIRDSSAGCRAWAPAARLLENACLSWAISSNLPTYSWR